jgi:DNA-binding NtrC family response regulator
VNCGAIAPELLESELFGHTKGAFTSAHQGREGLFVAASGGTLYLDEISEMPMHLEVKLLRVLEEGTIRPVGADQEVPVDVRIVASTQHDLQRAGACAPLPRGSLFSAERGAGGTGRAARAALRHPGAGAAFHGPVVRGSRRGAIAAGCGGRGAAAGAHDWPGNVRELKNFVERSLMLGESRV